MILQSVKKCNDEYEKSLLLAEAMSLGYYITQRGEGAFWVLHNPKGLPVQTALTREDLLAKLPRQFE